MIMDVELLLIYLFCQYKHKNTHKHTKKQSNNIIIVISIIAPDHILLTLVHKYVHIHVLHS